MRVLLINPPTRFMLTTNVPEFVDVKTGKYPPLGLLYVAGSLLETGRHQVEVLDCQLEELDYPQIESEIRHRQPELIGIQATTFTLIDVIKVCEICKKVFPEVPVVIGGPHTFLYPQETINLPGVNYVVLGEGEQNFPVFVDCLEAGSDFSHIKGLVYRQNGRIVNTGVPDLIENLDNLPPTPRELLPYKKYYSVLAQRTPITTMMSSRGCPYRCTFCARPHLGKKWRARSPENIVAEMRRCLEAGIAEIFFYDDTFNINTERVTKICELIIREKLDIFWDIRARVDLMTPELLKLLARTGCKRIHYGVEAGTEPMIKVLRKEVDLSRVREVFRHTRRNGISTLGYFMIGNPGETREQILATIKFALELDADYVHFSVTTPFPGTELYHQGLKSGVIQKDYWQEFVSNPQPNFVPPVWEEKFTREELINFLRYAYKKFYLRPKYIISQLLRVRTLGELMRKARAGVSLALNT